MASKNKNGQVGNKSPSLQRLSQLLQQMFQLNQPDLDFGLYRIMHAKSERVQSFIDRDLPKIAQGALADSNKSKAQETDVYDHLLRFFERYYSDGDFLSHRYLTRETASQAYPFAVPYDGSEVHLHWANRDQHYIKSAEQLMDFEFDLAKSLDLAPSLDDLRTEALPVACRLVNAEEGEHDNVKEQPEDKRTVVLHEEAPVALLTEGGVAS